MADFEILCFGETMAMFVAEQPGELDRVEQFGKRIAGADSNVAIGLARLGFAVAWLSRVGDDSLGRFVLDSLTREGLDCRFVEVDAQAPTGFQMKSREVDGADRRPAGWASPISAKKCSAPATCTPPAFRRHSRRVPASCPTN